MRGKRTSTMAALVAAALILPAAAAAQPATIVVENQLDRSLLVWIDGDLEGVVPANGVARFEGRDTGRVSLLAGDSRGIVASEKTTLSGGETFTWTLFPVAVFGEERGTGVVVVENDLDHAVEVRLGGNLFGRLAPGAVRVEPRIVAGNLVAVASSDTRGVVAEKTLTIVPGEIVRWRIGQVAGP
jgi:hypothetical protein